MMTNGNTMRFWRNRFGEGSTGSLILDRHRREMRHADDRDPTMKVWTGGRFQPA